jgi:hypothetical protein
VDVRLKFTLEDTNDTTAVKETRTAAMQGVKPGFASMIDNNILFVRLQPGCYLKITDIVIKIGPSYLHDSGMTTVAPLAVAYPLDHKPWFPYQVVDGQVVSVAPDETNNVNAGCPSVMADAKIHRLGFHTNGTMKPEHIVVAACETLIMRCKNILSRKYQFQLAAGDNAEYRLSLDETPTVGELFMRTVLDIFPDIPAVSYKEETISNVIILRCRCDDISKVVETAMRRLIDQFAMIASFFA